MSDIVPVNSIYPVMHLKPGLFDEVDRLDLRFNCANLAFQPTSNDGPNFTCRPTTMGNSSSNEDDEFDKFDGIETLGYRVLGVQPDSPASQAGLVSFFDFLVGANNKMLLGSGEGLEEGAEYDDVDLPGLLQENLGKEIELRK